MQEEEYISTGARFTKLIFYFLFFFVRLRKAVYSFLILSYKRIVAWQTKDLGTIFGIFDNSLRIIKEVFILIYLKIF